MRTLRTSVFIACSLDGYIARPDDGLDFLTRVERPGEDYGHAAYMASVDVLVLGRRTYDVVLGFPEWPYGTKRCVVYTRRPALAQRGEEFFAGTPEALCAHLEATGARSAYIDGGATIRAFLDAGCIDALTVSVIPVLLGAGIPLWAQGGREHGLTLREAKSYPSGLVQLVYTLGAAAEAPASF